MADTVTVRVPLAIRKRGGRKVVVSPDGSVLPTAPRHVTTNADPSLLKALGRAFRWKRLLDDGTDASVSDIARAEKLDRTYVGDVLRLTLLAPGTITAILDGAHDAELTLPSLMAGVDVVWECQPCLSPRPCQLAQEAEDTGRSASISVRMPLHWSRGTPSSQ
jgi:hypothetical protein